MSFMWLVELPRRIHFPKRYNKYKNLWKYDKLWKRSNKIPRIQRNTSNWICVISIWLASSQCSACDDRFTISQTLRRIQMCNLLVPKITTATDTAIGKLWDIEDVLKSTFRSEDTETASALLAISEWNRPSVGSNRKGPIRSSIHIPLAISLKINVVHDI